MVRLSRLGNTLQVLSCDTAPATSTKELLQTLSRSKLRDTLPLFVKPWKPACPPPPLPCHPPSCLPFLLSVISPHSTNSPTSLQTSFHTHVNTHRHDKRTAGFPRTPTCASSLSPYVTKVEAWLRFAKLAYRKENSRADRAPKGKVRQLMQTGQDAQAKVSASQTPAFITRACEGFGVLR